MEIIEEFKTYSNNNFEFSPFQIKACLSIIKNKHVLITAHTGSGKTLPGEFSIYYQIKHLNKKVIYTSPIKALSNQKFQEFSKKFPDFEVGILTGDIKHNPEADLLIMTTEILQNHCFKINNNCSYLDFNMDLNNELGSVIFDEVHYIDDVDRGTVWEQTMIMLPDHVPFVMLSATIGKKESFANWISTIKNKEVVICSTEQRVVPLEFYEYFNVPTKYVDNIKDKTKKQLFQNKLKQQLNLIKTNQSFNKSVINSTKKCLHEMSKDNYRVHQKFVLNELMEHLKQNDMFPCLCFVFSRKQVELIANQITTNLFLEDEKDYSVEPIFRQLLVSKITNWKEYIELPEYQTYLNLLEKGIGVHHAGMLPVFKETIEILYDKKYIKALIATETFAIGLNMPTRSVIFTSLYKHDGVQLRKLHSHEFIQMAGRAGRRGIDTKGNVILMTNCYEPYSENEYQQLFYNKPKVLKSKFKINYNLILNFLETKSYEQLVKMVQNSMMNVDILYQINESNKIIDDYKKQIENNNKLIQQLDFDLIDFFNNYFDLLYKIEYSKNKEKKRLTKQKNEIEINEKKKMEYLDLYENHKQIKNKEKKEREILYYAEHFVENQINAIIYILKKECFVNDENKLSSYGINSSHIHELPCLVFNDFYEKYLKQNILNETEILCILSCFYELKIKDENKVIIPLFLKNEIKFINNRINYYKDYELKHEIYINNEIELQYDLMELMKDWYENINNNKDALIFFDKLKNTYDIFIGDFIKACLKIVNMINEIKILCQNDNNYNLLEKIETIQQNIQKNIVSNSSLYL